MGRHGAPPDPDARLIGALPGWGAFASAVAAVSVGWVAGSWPPAAGVAALGLGSTGVLWCAARRGTRTHRRPRPAPARSPQVTAGEGHDDVAERRSPGGVDGDA